MWAFLEFLKAIWPSIVGALKMVTAAKVGQAVAHGEAAKRDLDAIQNAADAVARNRARPVDERLRNAHERGLYRVSGKSSDDQRG